ncbi:hypothetical protein [Polyangium aurulentum]|uniref:hypothetical protein n=1 Tax=Polyangium aurulentum TaxID=2567896 RepID=UPI0010AE0A41|nr:hypothetical protein [Polyangium aurulentum]UQA60272.1 hypothetical protein E8A73_007285 [Polyangium aurulentum]
MADRIVVSFHGAAEELHAPAPSLLERALSIKKRAEARGASACAWSGETWSYDFAPEEIDKALALALEHTNAEASVGIGVAQGDLRVVSERSGEPPLSWGRPVVLAERLARLARAGEVLIDPDLAAVQAGEIVTAGARAARVSGGARARGLKLDLVQPFRRQALARVSRMDLKPPFVGRAEELSKLASAPLGCLALVRAAPGAGGTRLLEEAAAHLRPSRILRIAPSFAPREPLGALRTAFARGMGLEEPPELSERLNGVLEGILSGEGVEPAAASELVAAWLAPVEGRSGLLTLDDAGLVDTATLEVIAGAALPRGFFRALARVGAEEPIPAMLASLPVAVEVFVGPLAQEDAERLATSFVGGALAPVAARRWARLGGWMPLAIREAMAEGLTSGALRWSGGKAEPRGRASGRGRPEPASAWLAKRAGYLPAGHRAALVALALIGGDAPAELIDGVATLMEGAGARVSVVEDSLIAGGWAERPEEGWLAVASRSVGVAILEALDEGTRMTWHRMIGRMLERNVGALGLAEPAYHAAQAGERASAAKLAVEAARAAMNAGLVSSAASLAALARAWHPEIDVSDLPASREEAPIESLALSSVIERASAFDLVPVIDARTPDEPTSAEPRPRTVAEEVAALADDPEATTDPDVMAARVSALTKQALIEGDLHTLEHLIVRLRVTGEHHTLVERMSAFVMLGRGSPGDALRKLYAAVEASQTPRTRAQAQLAYGVALASVGRADSALLEALEALARAREASDRRGEQACARFLAYLSAAVGQPGAASVWAKVARG